VLGLDEAVPAIDATELHARIHAGAVSVVDVDWSRDYRDAHIPGAWFGIRARLEEVLPKLPHPDAVVFTSSDGVLARLAAADARRIHSVEAGALEGGTAAWRAAGFPLEAGATRMASVPDDIRLRAREQEGGVEAAMRAYLEWEINLAEQMARDEDHRFRIQAP
jgi:rhodanese-related sulfurtransferase